MEEIFEHIKKDYPRIYLLSEISIIKIKFKYKYNNEIYINCYNSDNEPLLSFSNYIEHNRSIIGSDQYDVLERYKEDYFSDIYNISKNYYKYNEEQIKDWHEYIPTGLEFYFFENTLKYVYENFDIVKDIKDININIK